MIYKRAYQKIDSIGSNNTKLLNEMATINKGRPRLGRISSGLLGLGVGIGFLGLQYMGKVNECGEYGVHKSKNYFTTSIPSLFKKGANNCFLTMQGASEISNNPRVAKKFCSE